MPRRLNDPSFRAVTLDPDTAEPLHRQLYDELRKAILSGRIAPGTRLPASRELAADTHVSRNTVLSAYEQLLAEGYVSSRGGSGTFVARTIPEATLGHGSVEAERGPSGPRELSESGRRILATPLVPHAPAGGGYAFRPGLPALDRFPMEIWRRMFDRRLRRASMRTLTYDDPQGHFSLREAVAAHLTAVRGASCAPENILIVNGAQQAIDLVARVLLDRGDRVVFEDPGYFAARAAFVAHGATIVPFPVDDEGLDISGAEVRAPGARLAYCTPSHQNPLGVTMSFARRAALLRWAERTGAWILEDDNASEYRYRGRPLASLQGIDQKARVIHAGTFSKVLYSSLRLGYMVAPPDLVPALVRARALSDRQSPGVLQDVLADFMSEGHFARHVRRMRTLYGARLDALVDAVRQHAADVFEIRAGEGGMSRVVWLPEGVDDVAAARELARVGLASLPLSAYRIEPGKRGGLILGFAGVEESEIEAGVRLAARAVRAVMGRAAG